MLNTLFILPPAFWVAAALLAAGGVWAAGKIRAGIGLPVLAVLGTVAAWYAGDALYNDYSDYVQKFTPGTMENAWWETAWFVIAFLFLAPMVHRMVNARHLSQTSRAYEMFRLGVNRPDFQTGLNRLFEICSLLWLVLSIIAVLRLGADETPYYFFPFLGHLADPWSRGRMGGGVDALLSLAAYLLFNAAVFGVVAALSTNPRVRNLARLGCLLTWPCFIFNRTRNTMLAVVIPGLLAWVFLRVRGGLEKKLVILAVFFVLVSAWFGFVIANRSSMSIAAAVKEGGFNPEEAMEAHHEGLNLYEELCWINTFIEDGRYEPEWGQEYLDELANPVPRSLWPGKPTIGLDYAVLRGQAGGEEDQGGVYATISTGMIGQGVVNFGRLLGPVCAALLMSLWVAVLARLDLRGSVTGNFPLYALGIILTFNMGRDITLLVLYPFVFGALIIWWLGRRASPQRVRRRGRKNQDVTPPDTAPFSATLPAKTENLKAEN
jgi:hypothetical protein